MTVSPLIRAAMVVIFVIGMALLLSLMPTAPPHHPGAPAPPRAGPAPLRVGLVAAGHLVEQRRAWTVVAAAIAERIDRPVELVTHGTSDDLLRALEVGQVDAAVVEPGRAPAGRRPLLVLEPARGATGEPGVVVLAAAALPAPAAEGLRRALEELRPDLPPAALSVAEGDQ